ncbi:ROK family transcriptional regulator [Microtetraspora malaysiensis]|uniref:ROK family transcriptional regulator n=1 Tax=Microtetraspora malaysiensis TaxID=161358 RepID=UPI00082C1F22|nr:ROK family transcriptional regulator [Microtetraspora malaysiensis]
MTQAVRHDAMRARNLALVLGEVSARGSVTRAALAEITGLAKTTVSKLIADLIEAGLVVETGIVRAGERGRPGMEVQVSGLSVAAIGLEINVDYLAAHVVDLSRSVRLRRARPVDNRLASPGDVIANLQHLALSAVDEAVDIGLRVVGGVLAVPGTVDLTTGTVRRAPNLGWRDVPLLSLLRMPFPIRVDNEANLAALGELWFGAGHRDFLHVSGEIGVGAGLVVRGELFRGFRGFAGELGHVVVSPGGPPCHCGGQGCLERYAGQDALLSAAGLAPSAPSSGPGQDATRLPASPPPPSGPEQGPGRRPDPGCPAPAVADTPSTPGHPGTGIAELLRRLEASDSDALAACERAGWALGIALTSAVNLVDPERIVLGGIYAPLFPWIGGAVTETLTARLGEMREVVPSVEVSRLGTEAAPLGAAGQVIHQIIADPAGLLNA